MNTVSEYLKQYLTFNRSVSIGMLGIFSSQHTGASIHPIIHEFHPPSALLSFEEDASCDTSPQFIELVAKHAGVSIQQASEMIDNFRSEIWNALKTDTSFHIIQFGSFKRMPNHSTEFEQDENIQLNAMAFGLPSFILQSDGQINTNSQEEEVSKEEIIPEIIEPSEPPLPVDEEHIKHERVVLPKMEVPQKPVVAEEEIPQEEIVPEIIEPSEPPLKVDEKHIHHERVVLPKMEVPQKPVVAEEEIPQEEIIPEIIEPSEPPLPVDEEHIKHERVVLPKMEVPQKPVVAEEEIPQEEIIPEIIEPSEPPLPIDEEHIHHERVVLPKMEVPQKPVVAKEEIPQEEINHQAIETPEEPETAPASFSEEIVLDSKQQQAITPKKKKRKKSLAWLFILLIFAASGVALYVTGYWEVVYEKAKSIAGTEAKTNTVENTDNETTATAENLQTTSAQTVETPDTSQTIAEDQTQGQAIQATKTNEPIQSQHHKYFIVADCFRDIQLAEKRAKDLQSQGYSSSVAGKTKQGLHIVTYGGFSEKAEAENMLKDIQKNVQGDSWLYIK